MTWLSDDLRPPPPPAFRRAEAWLDALRPRGIKLGLDRVHAALKRLDVPYRRLKAVTIAGTNGKGSTATFLASVAHSAGYRVGLYTSPHLSSVTERIRVAGTAILPTEFAAWIERIRRVVEGTDRAPAIPLTYFEVLTVMALGYFAAREVDLAVLEVGMGGRLDATRVVPPLVSVITPVGLDHQAYLGDTVEAICREKAGIIQRGATVVCHVKPALFRRVIGPAAFDRRCPIRRLGVDFVHQWLQQGYRYRGWIHRLGPVRLGIRGLHQGINASLACAAAESLCAHGFSFKPFHIADGLHRARHPGRLERRAATVTAAGERWPALLLDVAHNPMGARTLAHHLDGFLPERPRVMLFSARADKDVGTMLDVLTPKLDTIVLTQTPDTALVDPDTVARVTRLPVRLVIEPELHRALTDARALAAPRGGLLVTGGIYFLGRVLPLLPDPPTAWG